MSKKTSYSNAESKVIVESIIIMIGIIVCFCLVGILFIKNSLFDKELEKIKLIQNQIEIQEEVIEKKEVENHTDPLKRKIELYIKTTHPRVSSVVAKEISHQIIVLSENYKISHELVLGIIQVESSFNPMAVGSKTKYGHARGLMQVMPEWTKKLGLDNQYDFHEINIGIESGIRVFLIHLEEEGGDISKGLYCYVNKDDVYVNKVYEVMGKFVSFSSSSSDNTQTEKETNEPKQ